MALTLCLPAVASADGDPGSDVLLDQSLFYGFDDGVTPAQELSIDHLLAATAKAGAPVRVAIIGRRDDLGTVTKLWNQPQLYAEYLGEELSLTYPGRLLIVMPSGFGVYDHSDPGIASKLQGTLSGQKPASGSGAALVTAATSAVYEMESAAGVAKSALAVSTSRAGTQATNQARADSGTPAADSGSKAADVGAGSQSREASAGSPAAGSESGAVPGNAGGGGDAVAWSVVAIVVVLLMAGWVAVRAGLVGGERLRGWLRPRPAMIVPVALVAVVIAALAINHGGSSPPVARGGTLATNPDLDPGTKLGGAPAPNFALTDESGRPVSLSRYRGKVVILSFVDDECQTICPLTTQAMLDAKAALGKAGRNVQLLGVNANWKSLQIDDVLNYTELHGLSGQWHFLTGTLPSLQRVWSAYHVNEKALVADESNDIEHIAATYVIGPDGRLRDVFTTYPSYGAIAQVGQLLANDAAALLPGHPKVSTDYSYAQVKGIAPSRTATLPKLGGGTVKLGPGADHLYLFFATWDAQTTPIAAELDALNGYAAQARRRGLPALTAVDEASVEPSSRALPTFIRSLPQKLDYPVAQDTTGQVADGYDVQGEPWYVLTNAAGQIVWYQEVYTAGWPKLDALERDVRAALRSTSGGTVGTAAAKRLLAGSPQPLAALHAQSSQLLVGGQSALDARIAALKGYPIVLNIWGSWCGPCQQEFGLFANASAHYGKRVAFLGADTNDAAANARAFLRAHPVSYPSYATTDTSIQKILKGGLIGMPTTVYIGANGKIVSVHTGQYESLGSLEQDIGDVAPPTGASN